VRAVLVERPGGPKVLRWGEAPDPSPAPDEVLIAVHATAVNRADLLQREGHYPPPPGASSILGLEASGAVVDVGAEVTDWAAGDRVCALLTGGGYAELVAVPAGQVLQVPAGVDLVTAATLPEVACTVWSNLVLVAALTAGQSVLVHGGGGGVGSMAVQAGRALGARVLATTGGAEKAAWVRSLGADVVVDYRADDLADQVREATDGRGVDVILDVMGGRTLETNVACLAVGGTLVVIGLQGGRRGTLDLGLLLARRARVVGTTLRSRPAAEKAAIVAAVRQHLWPLVEQGQVRPVVDRVLPITQVVQAHELMAAGTHRGKIALQVR
jgi:putative PIG3 family NAD(P)H quinone oxidoreductase